VQLTPLRQVALLTSMSRSIHYLMLNEETVRDTDTVSIEHFFFFFFSYACHEPQLVSHETASSSEECSRDKMPFSFVSGQDSTMWDIVWVSPQGHSKSPFPSAGTTVSVFHAKTVQQRPLLPTEIETWLPDCGVAH